MDSRIGTNAERPTKGIHSLRVSNVHPRLCRPLINLRSVERIQIRLFSMKPC
jgi:hypothetical protein